MSAASTSVHPAQQKKGVVAFILKIIGVLFLSMIISILLEWAGMTWWWPEEGEQHAFEMMQKEIGYLGGNSENTYNGEAVSTASGYIHKAINTMFIDSGVIEAIGSIKQFDQDDNKLTRYIKSALSTYYEYLMAAVFIIIMFMVRLSILFLSIPAFLLFGAVGMTDGLVQRDLRRWCGGHESSYVYHWAKKLALPTLVITWFVYLTIPNSIHPNFVITPFAVLFGLVLMVMSSRFKKYL
ncbi:MAG: TIGR03747 family integrating conjugative element membrane protein [Methylococcales bacterium]